MGVDVGKRLHVVIREKVDDYKHTSGKLWFAGDVASFDDLDLLMARFNVASCVIDSQPEGHLAAQFASRFPYKVWLCMYNRNQPGHERLPRTQGRPNFLHANRTEALDEMTQRIKQGAMPLPETARSLGDRLKDGMGDYYRHLLSIHRTIESDDSGNLTSRWFNGTKPDHFAHAEVYCLLAGTTAYISGLIEISFVRGR
jgi:hypothetical protein